MVEGKRKEADPIPVIVGVGAAVRVSGMVVVKGGINSLLGLWCDDDVSSFPVLKKEGWLGRRERHIRRSVCS